MADDAGSKLTASQMLERVLSRLNAARLGVGARALQGAPTLTWAAQDHAADMAQNGYFDYVSPTGVDPARRAESNGYSGRIGANLISGTSSPEEAADGWLSGDDSRRFVLDPDYHDLGVGECCGKWVLILGVCPGDAPPAPAPAPLAASAQTPSRKSRVEVGPELAPRPAAVAEPTSELRQRALDLINHHRSLARAPLCDASTALDRAAQLHVIDMVKRDYFDYAAPDGHSLLDLVKEVGYSGTSLPSIARGVTTADQLCETLLQSDSHKKTLLDPDVRHVGVGVLDGRWTVICGVPAAETSPEIIQRMLELLNAERQRLGTPPLSLSDALVRAAQAHTVDMVRRGYFNYVHADGSGLAAQLKAAGYSGWSVAAITKGQATPQSALEVWRKSNANWANLLMPQCAHLGVGVAASHWTVVLGA